MKQSNQKWFPFNSSDGLVFLWEKVHTLAMLHNEHILFTVYCKQKDSLLVIFSVL